MSLPENLQNAWAVLMLFLIPIGGGIPGGVLLAQKYGFEWPIMMLLYLISDVILATLLEPILIGFFWLGKRVHMLERFGMIAKQAVQKSIAHYGTNTGPLALIIIAFGVDPMTGRAAAAASGHGFITGWMIAIAGDMGYFTVLMICTLWLQSIVGDGTIVMLIILSIMILAPIIVRKFRERAKLP